MPAGRANRFWRFAWRKLCFLLQVGSEVKLFLSSFGKKVLAKSLMVRRPCFEARYRVAVTKWSYELFTMPRQLFFTKNLPGRNIAWNILFFRYVSHDCRFGTRTAARMPRLMGIRAAAWHSPECRYQGYFAIKV